MTRPPLRRATALAAALLATPLVLGALPSATAAPSGGKALGVGKKSAPAVVAATPAARVVVADIDDGINPYHERYYADGPSEVTPAVLAELGVTSDQVFTLTRTGDLAKDFAADKASVWDRVERGKPYHFAGTNIVGISFDDSATPIFGDGGDTHGTGTSSAVLDANPEAVLLFVEGMANPDAETYAFTHPAVDVVTTSYGLPGSPPIPQHVVKSYEGVVGLGKLHFGASDNSPALSPPDGTSGPWWSIGVAGFHETGEGEDGSGGREALSGNVVDLVSDFTQTLPYCSDCESGEQSVSGTSFATPRAAGTASKVVLEARRAAGHTGGPVVAEGSAPALVKAGGVELTNWDFRRAFEEAAHYPSTADFSPTLDTHLPVLDAAPYLQTGWGVFSPNPSYGVVDEALAQLGVRGEARAPKGGLACAFNTAQFELRKTYWDNAAVLSESFLTSEDPYRRC